jgi:hypothetical protein
MGILLIFTPAVKADPAEPCCDVEQCASLQCIDTGCIAGACAICLPESGVWHGGSSVYQFSAEPRIYLMTWYGEIWTPPD